MSTLVLEPTVAAFFVAGSLMILVLGVIKLIEFFSKTGSLFQKSSKAHHKTKAAEHVRGELLK